MKLLTRYILKEFIITFFFGLLFFSLIFLISEFFYRLNEFIKYHATLLFILRYLLIHMPLWVRDSLPIAVLFGMIFSLSRLQRDGEITALKACAVNIHIFLFHLIVLSLVFVFVGIILNFNAVQNVFQRAREMRKSELKGESGSMPKSFANIVYDSPDGMQFAIGNFDFELKTMYDVTINKFSPDYALIEQLKAKEMVYTNGIWRLKDILRRKFSSDGKELVLEQKLGSEILRISEKPEDFIPYSKEIDMMSTTELKTSINRQLRRCGVAAANELVAYHLRFAYPFASFVVVFIAIPFALGLGGKFVRMRGLGYVLVISFAYWILVSVARVLGEAQLLPAILSAWLGNIVFLIIGLVLFIKISR
ncbi:MAG: LptF/LptG family permease [Elusimicrobiota bacterium]|nr:LptF/LptG family permease [Elusimicrobiota bacterium]